MDALLLVMVWLSCNLFDDRRCDIVVTLFVEKLREEVGLGKIVAVGGDLFIQT